MYYNSLRFQPPTAHRNTTSPYLGTKQEGGKAQFGTGKVTGGCGSPVSLVWESRTAREGVTPPTRESPVRHKQASETETDSSRFGKRGRGQPTFPTLAGQLLSAVNRQRTVQHHVRGGKHAQ